MAKRIAVKAAQPIGDQVIESVEIVIDGHYSEKTEDLNKLRWCFKTDALAIFNGLRSLPGGTFDQLLILMLYKLASSFVVSRNFHDEHDKKEQALIAASSSMLALLEKALPIIEREAEQRQNWGEKYNQEGHPYATEMRDLANEIQAEIDKAYGREVIHG